MSLYYLSFAAAAVISALLTPLLISWAKSRRIFMPTVRDRDLHQMPTPRVGGLAVVTVFVIIAVVISFTYPESLSFTDSRILGFDRNLFGLLLGILLLSAVNAVDDYRSVAWPIRLVIQIIAAAIVVSFGIEIQWLSNPLGGQIMLGGLGWLFVIMWLVGLTNVVNWLDGVNGLSSGVGAIAMAVLFFLSISPAVAQSENALLAAIALGAIIGFLPYNIVRAKAFLGDTGSQFLGFLIGVLAIISGGKVATAFLVLAIPFMDAIVVFGSRLINRQSPFLADKRHLHHRLLDLGLKPWQIVSIFYLVSLAFGLIALNTQTLGKFQAALAALALMVILVMLYSLKPQNQK